MREKKVMLNPVALFVPYSIICFAFSVWHVLAGYQIIHEPILWLFSLMLIFLYEEYYNRKQND